MSNRIVIVLVLCMASIKLSAQTGYPTENANNIYWQSGAQIDFSDYQSPTSESCIKYNEQYGLTMSSSIGFRGIVDVPKRKGKYDKFYLAPVFCRNCSCILSEDSLCLSVDRLLFDITEVCVRGARKELLELRETMNSDNTYTMFFTTVKNTWEEKMWSFFGTIIREVLIEKKEGAYVEWRQTVDEILQQTELYATQAEDCYRFVLGKPIEKNYEMAKTIAGDLRNKNEKEE